MGGTAGQSIIHASRYKISRAVSPSAVSSRAEPQRCSIGDETTQERINEKGAQKSETK